MAAATTDSDLQGCMAPGRGFLALGKVEEVIGDNVGFSDEDSDNDSDSSSASPAGPVLSLDTMVWSELVGRRRSYLGRCRCLLELLPWGLWWYLGLGGISRRSEATSGRTPGARTTTGLETGRF